MTKRLRWRKTPIEKGRAGWFSDRESFDLMYGDENLANVGRATEGFSRKLLGYAWSCPKNKELGIEWNNTFGAPLPTIDEAKAQCKEYIESCLKQKGLR